MKLRAVNWGWRRGRLTFEFGRGRGEENGDYRTPFGLLTKSGAEHDMRDQRILWWRCLVLVFKSSGELVGSSTGSVHGIYRVFDPLQRRAMLEMEEIEK